jgi:hypothetical protein
MEFEPMIPVFELEKTVHAVGRAATVTGITVYSLQKNVNFIMCVLSL